MNTRAIGKGFWRTVILAVVVAVASAASARQGGARPEKEQAGRILETTGVKGGLVVHLTCGDGKLTAALRANDGYLVHGLDADAKNVETARKHIQSLGLYGKVSVERWDADALPYTDNLVNLLVSENLGNIPMAEVMRVLAPKGIAYVKKNGTWEKTVKPRPKEIDEWTHYLHDASNNAVARDSVVGPPRHLQWVANPLRCRSHETDSGVAAMVSANGRIFYILDEGLMGITDERLPAKWTLIARDAFNGVLLWKRPIPRWGWREWKKENLEGKDWSKIRSQRILSPISLPRRLVANGNRVYVTLGYRAPVTALDAATGRIVQTYEETTGTDEIIYDDGTLSVWVRDTLPTLSAPSSSKKRRKRFNGVPAAGLVLAIQAETGTVLWRKSETRILPLSLTVSGDRVFFHSDKTIVCLNLHTGAEVWRVPTQSDNARLWGIAQTLVVHQGVVLFLGPKNLEAFSAKTGKPLWTKPGAKGPGAVSPPDLFVADGLVWYGQNGIGLDLITGKVKRKIEAPNLITPGHHFRCYRSKATDRYILWSKRGVEFLDLKSQAHSRNDWLRATCRLGFLPCNGLLYRPPDQCFCYPGVKLNGFNALAARIQAKRSETATRSNDRLEQNATNTVSTDSLTSSKAEDWPTYRHDSERSGSTTSAVPIRVKHLWQTTLGGKITSPVVADGKLFVASVDTHTVYALNAQTGEPLWKYTAGGRVDSPPTIYQGLVLFGSADGWAYCLRADDGAGVWRFRGGPEDRRVVAFGQLESPWPVHGSVLVKDGVAYFAAGRSSYLDGGIYVYGLDSKTGKMLHETCLDGPHPDPAKDLGRPFDMEGALSDVLVSDGTFLYMQQIMLDRNLKPQAAPRITEMGDRKVGRHLFSTAGLLDDSWWNRTFWMYSERWPGFYIANQAPKAGQLLVFDDGTTYGVKCYTRRNCHSPMFFPGQQGYLLFADDNDTEPMLVDKTGVPKPVKWLPEVSKDAFFALNKTAVDRDKGTGFTRARPPKWFAWVPVRIRAMVLSDKTLFVAGPPDVLDRNDPLAAFEGRKGALLRAVSTVDGKTLAEYKLDSPPVFDGMIAANSRLYIVLQDGRLICMGK